MLQAEAGKGRLPENVNFHFHNIDVVNSCAKYYMSRFSFEDVNFSTYSACS